VTANRKFAQSFPSSLTSPATNARKRWLVCNKPAISTISSANGIKRPILETASSLYGAKWDLLQYRPL